MKNNLLSLLEVLAVLAMGWFALTCSHAFYMKSWQLFWVTLGGAAAMLVVAFCCEMSKTVRTHCRRETTPSHLPSLATLRAFIAEREQGISIRKFCVFLLMLLLGLAAYAACTSHGSFRVPGNPTAVPLAWFTWSATGIVGLMTLAAVSWVSDGQRVIERARRLTTFTSH